MDQPGKVANPARGQLNTENEYSPVPPCVPGNLVSRDGFSRPVPCVSLLISILRLNLVLTYLGFLPSSAAAFYRGFFSHFSSRFFLQYQCAIPALAGE